MIKSHVICLCSLTWTLFAILIAPNNSEAQTLTGASGVQRVFAQSVVGSSVDRKDLPVTTFNGANKEHKLDSEVAVVSISGSGTAQAQAVAKAKVDTSAKTVRADCDWDAAIVPQGVQCSAAASSFTRVETDATTTTRTWTTARFKFTGQNASGFPAFSPNSVGSLDCKAEIGNFYIRVRYQSGGWLGQPIAKKWRVDSVVQTATGQTSSDTQYLENTGNFGFDRTYGSYHNTGSFKLKAKLNWIISDESNAFWTTGLQVSSTQQNNGVDGFVLMTIKNQ